jgi:hypothetical protein
VEAFGKDWFEVREGEATIFKPKTDGGTVVVARVLIEEWPAIAAAGVKR